LTATWIHAGGGYEWPLALFAVWASTVCLLYLLAVAPRPGFHATMPDVARALQCGALSVPAYLVGMVLLAFWPVTVTIGFLFAICRFATASSPHSAAY